MLRMILFGCLVCGLLGGAHSASDAGRNQDGALIVHSDAALLYTSGPPDCGSPLARPADCAAANPNVETPGGGARPIVWVLAAFPAHSSPAVTVAQFGIQHTVSPGAVAVYGYCDPVLIDIPTRDWPASGSGISLALYPAATGRIIPLCWFAVSGSGGDSFSTTRDPDARRAVFVDDGSPPSEDEIDRFGTARWGAAGSNECPPASLSRETNWGEVKARYRQDD